MSVTSTNMGLVKWTSLSDRFDYEELADNFEKIDGHDHVPLGDGGNGGTPIPAGGLGLLSVATENLQDAAVETIKIANNAVTSDKLKSSVSTDNDRAVSTNHIKDGAVTLAKLGSGITEEIDAAIQLGVNEIESLKIAPEAWRESTGTGSVYDLVYSFDKASTANSDPGSATVKFNDATLADVTEIYISSTDDNAVNITSTLAAISGGDKKSVVNVFAEAGAYATYRIDSYTSYGGTYFALIVTYIESSGNLADLPTTNTVAVDLYSIVLENGWTGPFRFYKDATGRVFVEMGRPGVPASGPWNAVATHLPEGYRPTDSVWIPSSSGILRINPDGAVRPMNDVTGITDLSSPEASYFVASGSFRAA